MPSQQRPHRPGDELPDDCKLYVAGLPPGFDDEAVKAVFSPFGHVLHTAVIKDHMTQAPKYAFVHFGDAATARSAADGMHGKALPSPDGEQRLLTVKLRSERHQAGGGGGTGVPGQHAYDECKLYCAFLPQDVSEGEVHALFAEVGPVQQVRLITDKETGRPKGYAFVTLHSRDAAQAAIQRFDGYSWRGSTLSVAVAGDKSAPRRPPAGGGTPGGVPPRPAAPYAPPNPNPHMAQAPSYGMPRAPPPGYGHPPGAVPMYQPGMPPAPYPGALPHAAAPAPYPGAPPPGYGAPPPGYNPGYAAPPPASYGAPAAHMPPGYPAPPPGYGAPPPMSAPPPLPGEAPPPLPPEESAAPAPPPANNVQSEYERFMSEMGAPR